MNNYNKNELTNELKDKLSIFDKVGVGLRDNFSESPPNRYDPSNLMSGYKSVIVFAQGGNSKSDVEMGGFSDYLGTIAAQSEAIELLESLGYKGILIEGTSTDVSLVRLGIEAGVGELSPVDSLLVEGFGLTVSLGAIITDAELLQDERVSGVCIKCMKCLKVCPIRDVPNAKGDLSRCACGACRNKCPV